MKEIDFRRDLLPLKDKIYRLGLRITLNAQEAEDLTQDTLLKAWAKRGELAEVANLEAWCMAVCRNMALDRNALKENANQALDLQRDDKPDTARSPQEQMEIDEKLAQVRRIINSLPEKQRTALQLRDVEGMSYRQAADVMQTTEALFKVTLHRARQAVREQYEKNDNYGL